MGFQDFFISESFLFFPPFYFSFTQHYLHYTFGDFQVQDCTQSDKYIYWRLDKPLTWNQAQAACVTIDHGNLVSIHNYDENNVVMGLKETKSVMPIHVWIGLQCNGSCNSFSDSAWTDGTPVDYTKQFYRYNSGM